MPLHLVRTLAYTGSGQRRLEAATKSCDLCGILTVPLMLIFQRKSMQKFALRISYKAWKEQYTSLLERSGLQRLSLWLYEGNF